MFIRCSKISFDALAFGSCLHSDVIGSVCVLSGWTKFYEFSFADLRSGADIIDAICARLTKDKTQQHISSGLFLCFAKLAFYDAITTRSELIACFCSVFAVEHDMGPAQIRHLRWTNRQRPRHPRARHLPRSGFFVP